MEIYQLKEFITLVNTLSFNDTAEIMNTSHSSLTRHIQMMEKELDVKLFDRTTRTIKLTNFAKEFLPYAMRTVKDYDDGVFALTNMKDMEKGFFKLGVYYSTSEYEMDKFIKGFNTTVGTYEPVVCLGNLEDLEAGFKSRKFNVYTSGKKISDDNENFITFGDVFVKAVVSDSSEYRNKTKITYEDLEGKTLFLTGINSPFSKSILKILNNDSVNAKVKYYGRFEDSIDIIKNNNSVGLFYFRLEDIPQLEGIKILDFEPEVRFHYGLAYRDNLNKGEQAFVDYMKKIAEIRKK